MAKRKTTRGTGRTSSRPSTTGRVTGIVAVVLLIAAVGIFIFRPFSETPPLPGETSTRFSPPPFKKDGTLTFVSSDGDDLATIDIELADTEVERAVGLMYRAEMDENHGMLFVFPREIARTFWMKNTLIPLDIIFVASDSSIVTIRHNALPFDESHYASDVPAIYVVEVNAGFTDSLGIAIGDRIAWTIFEEF